MAQIDQTEVNVNWNKLGTVERQDYLYELIGRILIDDCVQGIRTKDPVLANELNTALNNIKL